MTFKHLSASVFAAAALCLGSVASAAPITPSFTTFGTLAGATFGGSGISNTAVAITQIGDGPALGLTATPRFSQPALTNNGAGVFTAQAGISPNPPSPTDPYATWNLGFYIGGINLTDFSYALLYDQDPAAGTQEAGLRKLTSEPFLVEALFQDSWNLGMNFLEFPTLNVFDPTRNGEYSFALIAYDRFAVGLPEAGRSAIVVNVIGGTNEVPTPGTLPLMGLALLGLAAVSRRHR